MGDLNPELRSFRKRPVYLGGTQNKGTSFLMVHQKAGFPDNRFVLMPNRSKFDAYRCLINADRIQGMESSPRFRFQTVLQPQPRNG
jgi:hypothetical protein